MADIHASCGVPCAGAIGGPGTLEGGDVILAGEVAFVGVSSRTNAEGSRQVALADGGHQLVERRAQAASDDAIHVRGLDRSAWADEERDLLDLPGECR